MTPTLRAGVTVAMQKRVCGLALGVALGMLGCDGIEGSGDDAAGTTGAVDEGGLDDDPSGPGMTGPGGGTTPIPDPGVGDTGDTGGVEDTGGEDTGGEDTGGEDTGGEDTGVEDTGGEDTGGEDTGSVEDTGGEDTGGFEETGGESGEQEIQISGVVVANVAPGGDGIGTLYVGLTPSIDCFDGNSSFVDIIEDADLSEIGNMVPFSITAPEIEISGGGYLLQVFLDDNEDAVFQNPGPGDMTMFPTGFEETAGCFELPDLDGNVAGQVVELDYIVP